MTTGRINQIAIHFPSPFLFSRRRSDRVLDKRLERGPETRSPQAVQRCTAQRRFGVCFISIRGSSCWLLHSFFNEINEEDTHLQHVACSFNESCSPLGVLASRTHAWIVHPSLFAYGPHDCTQSGPSPIECALLSQHVHHRRVLRLPPLGRGFFRGYSQSCVLFVKSDRLVCLRELCTQAPPAGSLVLRSFTTRSCC